MKAFTTALAVASAATAVSAQYYNITSRPFQLIAHTHNETYNGTAFDACHEGAGIAGLCVGSPGVGVEFYNTFNFNTSTSDNYPGYTGGALGLLTWNEIANGGSSVYNQPLFFYYTPSSNMVPVLFGAGTTEQTVAFDAHNRLNVPSFVDDTVTPPVYNDPAQPLYRWYICDTNYEGYVYPILNWKAGAEAPNNPSCVATHVVRKFIE